MFFIANILYNIWKLTIIGGVIMQKSNKVNPKQSSLILLSFICTVLAAFLIIYYGGNWIADQFTSSTVQSIVFIAIVFITLSLSHIVLRKILAYIVRAEKKHD